MSEIKIDLQGMQAFQRKLKLYVGKKRQMIEKETAKASINIHNGAVKRAPVNKKPNVGGRLRSSLRFSYSGLDAQVYTNVKYAPYVEFGTGTLVSVPAELKEIAEQFRGRGVRQVNLPAQPFMYPSLVEERPKYVNRVNKALGHEEI